jgi:hypothetical protein
MSDIGHLMVEVRGGNIIVSLSGSSYTVTYYKPSTSPQLLAKLFPVKDDPRARMTQGEFLAHAWRAATDKARVLGWIS